MALMWEECGVPSILHSLGNGIEVADWVDSFRCLFQTVLLSVVAADTADLWLTILHVKRVVTSAVDMIFRTNTLLGRACR